MICLPLRLPLIIPPIAMKKRVLRVDRVNIRVYQGLSSDEESEEITLPYDDTIEPVPTEEEAAEYLEQLAIEEEDEQTLLSRFSGEEDVSVWYVDNLNAFLPRKASFNSKIIVRKINRCQSCSLEKYAF